MQSQNIQCHEELNCNGNAESRPSTPFFTSAACPTLLSVPIARPQHNLQEDVRELQCSDSWTPPIETSLVSSQALPMNVKKLA